MPTPTVTTYNPPPSIYADPGVLRPEALVAWSGATGPTVDVLHEWDTDPGFGTPIQDLNAAVPVANTPNAGIPPSDMGPAATTWYYRATVTDNADAQSATTSTETLDWVDPIDHRRYLYELGNVGVGHDPIDRPAAGWGPDPDPAGGAPDGFAIAFRRYLYELANVDTTTPTPHIWYLYPTYGREGWEFRIVGFGFGATQATFSGIAELDGLAVGIISWELVAALGIGMEIDPSIDLANPVHQLIRATVPAGGTSGLVIVITDGP